MKLTKEKRLRVLPFLVMAAVFGTAHAGSFEIDNLDRTVEAGDQDAISFTIRNGDSAALSDIQAFANGSEANIGCAGDTANGNGFAFGGKLASRDQVSCVAEVQRGGTTSVTLLGTAADGSRISNTVHASQVMAIPAQSQVGILAAAVFNDADSDQVFDAGESIDFSYVIFNFGNTNLTGVSVSDDLNGPLTCPATTLAAGDTMECSVNHVIAGNEVNAPIIAANAFVDATGPGGAAASSADSVIRTPSSQAEIRGLKNPFFAQDNDLNNIAGPGDLVLYTFAVRNSGRLDLSPITITEPDPSRIDTAITCDATTLRGNAFSGPGTGGLVVGDTIMCEASYTIQDADVTAGQATNLANLTGQPPFGGVASGSAASAFVIPAAPTAPPYHAVPMSDWRTLLLLGLGLLGLGVVYRRRMASQR